MGKHRRVSTIARRAGGAVDPPGFHDDSDSHRPDGLVNRHGNLFRQPFLHLQSTAERFRNPSELGQAEDEFVGNIADRDLASRQI